MVADSIVIVRIGHVTKARAAAADEKRFPFDVMAPNSNSVRAIRESDRGKSTRMAHQNLLFNKQGL